MLAAAVSYVPQNFVLTQGPAVAVSAKLLNNPQFKTLTPLFKRVSVVVKAFGLANTFNKVCAFAPAVAT